MWVCFIITMTVLVSPPIFTVTASEPKGGGGGDMSNRD